MKLVVSQGERDSVPTQDRPCRLTLHYEGSETINQVDILKVASQIIDAATSMSVHNLMPSS